MSIPTLRSYQHLALLDVNRQWRAGKRRVVAVCPTGGGKTVTAAEQVSRELAAGRRVLWCAHRRELIDQAHGTLEAFGWPAGVIMGNDRRHNLALPLQVASVDTIRRGKRLARLADAGWVPDLMVIDECHHAVSASNLTLLETWPQARVLGLTATPWRLDGRGLGEAFDAIVTVTTPARLIELGFLVDVEVYASWAPDLKGVRKQGGDFAKKAAAERMNAGLGDVVRGIMAHDCGRTLVFAASVEHSRVLAEALAGRGVAAEHVDGKTPSDERSAIFGRLRSGGTQVVCNMGICGEGFDLPAIDTVVLARATASSGLFIQWVGRALRPSPGKAAARVLDYGGNVERHWWPTVDISRHYRLDGAPARDQAREAVPSVTTCLECYAVYPSRAKGSGCPLCGAQAARQAVKVEDKGTELRKAKRKAAPKEPFAGWSDKRAAWEQLRRVQTERGYKPMWCNLQFKLRFGHFPPRAWAA